VGTVFAVVWKTIRTFPLDVFNRCTNNLLFNNPNDLLSNDVNHVNDASDIDSNVASVDYSFQAYVISSRSSRYHKFLNRNRNHGGLWSNLTISWFPASNGRDQTILDEFSQLTGFPAINASLDYSRDAYDSPHHVGCFMSHWNILRLAKDGWKSIGLTPTALVIFEEDAYCASSLFEKIIETLPSLPYDWDMLFVGGKPFTYYVSSTSISDELKARKSVQNFTNTEFREVACNGGFGNASTGPFAPDGGRNLSVDQPFWQTKYSTNLHAYLVNPQRIDRILDILEHPPRGQEPIDIIFAEAARSNILKCLLLTEDHCIQQDIRDDRKPALPQKWEGYYNFHGLQDYHWNDLLFDECPDKP